MKLTWLIYGVVSYAIGLGGLTFFILYVGGWEFMPLHVNAAGNPGPYGTALLVNISLMVLFGVQHTVMARPGFKRRWSAIIGKPIERSTYVLLSGILMIVIALNWQPIEGIAWDVENSTARTLLNILHVSGWLVAVIATFLINHFELFGLQQVWLHFKGKDVPAPRFTERFLYRIVRHPLQMGILMGLWITPTMTMTLLQLSAMMTIYIVIGLHYEEKDLAASLGDHYVDYQRRVPKIVPIPK